MKPKPKTTEADAAIGRKIKKFRALKGMSQMELSEPLDISFQQLQKYEQGKNRVSAANIQKISQILSVPLSAFFEEDETIDSLKSDKQTKRLLRIWSRTSTKQKDDILAMMKLLVQNTDQT